VFAFYPRRLKAVTVGCLTFWLGTSSSLPSHYVICFGSPRSMGIDKRWPKEGLKWNITWFQQNCCLQPFVSYSRNPLLICYTFAISFEFETHWQFRSSSPISCTKASWVLGSRSVILSRSLTSHLNSTEDAESFPRSSQTSHTRVTFHQSKGVSEYANAN
jgi:hypothetical protein